MRLSFFIVTMALIVQELFVRFIVSSFRMSQKKMQSVK